MRRLNALIVLAAAVSSLACWHFPLTAQAQVINYSEQRVPAIWQTCGKIVEQGNGFVTVKGQGAYDLVTLKLGQEPGATTYILNGLTGKKIKASKLKTGDEVTAYYSSTATRSYPPQSQGYALLLGSPEQNLGHYYQVGHAQLLPGKNVVELTDVDGELIATVGPTACADWQEIKGGQKLLLWYDLMTLSLPARTNATKVLILE